MSWVSSNEIRKRIDYIERANTQWLNANIQLKDGVDYIERVSYCLFEQAPQQMHSFWWWVCGFNWTLLLLFLCILVAMLK
jgi:hypothetical protein